jgi:hypothetical protein
MNDELWTADPEGLEYLLGRVGLLSQESGSEGGETLKFDPFTDPAATERLGRALAARIEALHPDLVCVWEEPEDMVLGHVVSLALGTRWVRCVNADGLVGLVGSVPRGARCVIVTDVVRAVEPVVAMAHLMRLHGGEVIAVGALVGSAALDSVPVSAGAKIHLSADLDAGANSG